MGGKVWGRSWLIVPSSAIYFVFLTKQVGESRAVIFIRPEVCFQFHCVILAIVYRYRALVGNEHLK
jgi:hypothetical protein